MNFARRMARVAPSPTLKVAAEADRLRRAGVDVVDFGAGEPDFQTPANVSAAAHQASNCAGVSSVMRPRMDERKSLISTSAAFCMFTRPPLITAPRLRPISVSKVSSCIAGMPSTSSSL